MSDAVDKIKSMSLKVKSCTNKINDLKIEKGKLEERKDMLLNSLKVKGVDSVEDAKKRLDVLREKLVSKEAAVIKIDLTLNELVESAEASDG